MTEFAQIGGPAGLYVPADVAASVETHPLRDAELLALSPEEIAALDGDGVVELLGAARRRSGHTGAQVLRGLARLHELRDGDRYVPDEAGLELRISRNAADGLVDDALGLVDRMPTVLRLLDEGELDGYTARRLAQSCTVLSDERARAVDQLLGVKHAAGKLNLFDPVSVRRAVQRLVLKVDPEAARKKAAKARRERCVRLFPGEDTMSALYADLPAEVAAACYTRIDADARRLRNAGDERTLDQLRADVLAGLLTGRSGDGSRSGGAVVFLHMPITTALMMSDDGCELSGYGPIPGPVAREIMTHPDSVLRKVLVDPGTGEIKGLGRKRRRANQALRDLIAARDRECGFCNRPAAHCDADHLDDWQYLGGTDPDNLGAKCEHDHYLKDQPGWKLKQDPKTGDGTIITPTKREYPRKRDPIIEPPDPQPPPQPPPEREPQIEVPPF